MTVVCNTPDEVLIDNIKKNSALDREWIECKEANHIPAIMVGGGSSLKAYIEDIREHQKMGGKVFAMNGVAEYLDGYGIIPDVQVIVDARERNIELIGPAREYLFASQVHPSLFKAVPRAKVWHLEIGNIEDNFPPERVANGGYALMCSAISVGNSALGLAYALGHREFHIYGYDSSYKDASSHAYRQDMNKTEPTCEVEFGDKKYIASIAMKCQAEGFPRTSKLLKDAGCNLHVYGDGLCQAMYRAVEDGTISEAEKYRLMWANDAYRTVAPGEHCVEDFLRIVKPTGSVIDFGCGTGRGALGIRNAGYDVLCIDFASNCRDTEAEHLPFIEWDLTKPMPIGADHGYCTDVMEHIEPENVDSVIRNIMLAVDDCFFQISTVDDVFGETIGHHLHLTVEPHNWWADKFESLGFKVEWSEEKETQSLFHIRRI